MRRWLPDQLLALTVTAVAVVLHLAKVESIPANRDPDAWSVLFTIAALAPLVVRRRYPLAAFAACFPGLIALMVGHYAVGMAPLGALIAFYTVAAWGTATDARRAVGVLALGLVATALARPIDLSVEGAAVNGLLLLCGWVLGTGTRKRRALHAAQVADAARRLELERERASRAAAEERLRITRELHDVLGHAMSVMVVQAGVAQTLLASRPEEAAIALGRIAETGRSSLEEMRRLLTVIRDGTEPAGAATQPGLADLPALVADVVAAGLPVTLDPVPTGPRLPPGVELAAYRIVQEALTNTLRHAGPARAVVRLRRTAAAVEVDVRDDGRGPSDAAPGRGLSGMRERVAVYGGELVTGPDGERGFRVRARLPLDGLPAGSLARAVPVGELT
ncbi:MAG TPA: sensor histidine kinase [Mycobacteriales bacterium]|jgi:signal transduction histidine kinase|nr:sensor histidine kinase [Mycobacteriales bacterium]